MYSIGYDIGSSSIKCSILDLESGKVAAQGFHPKDEMEILSPKPGWAEQHPDTWWSHVVFLTKKLIQEHHIDPAAIGSIGISYQMHGLVAVDKNHTVLRPSIIWCDSRAVDIGNAAFHSIGEEKCLQHLLNSPGNFTASKLRWVRENEPDVYNKIHKIMLPGDYIAMKLTGEITTTISGLSEGIFWDFKNNSLSNDLLSQYKIDPSLIADIRPTFSVQGNVTQTAAEELGLRKGIPVSYRAGDQPNNAFSLNVLNPGEIAATAGTSGVVYGVIDSVRYDRQSRVNPFAHVNHTESLTRLGVLLCINGTGILNSWLRKTIGTAASYDEMNTMAATAPIGSDNLSILSFGNGAERILENNNMGAHVDGLDFNRHTPAHLIRAAHEGIAFSFRYGIDIMKAMGLNINVIRAGNTNMFLSPIFRHTLANITGASIELYDTDGAQGAARGAAVGTGYFSSPEKAFASLTKTGEVHPDTKDIDATAEAYQRWLAILQKFLS